MKQAGLFLTLVLCLYSIPTNAESFLLDEQQLFTRKKGCYIHYLTEKNTNGWYIETNREECDQDGVLTGYHHITVYNAFSKPIEKLYGYFSNGYWTGDAFLKKVEFQRFSDELGVQKATFTLPYQNEQDHVRYMAQMSTQKTSSGTYPAFHVCSPMRILGIVQDVKKLEDPHFLQRIFTHVEKQVRLMCPTDEKVMLFLSASDKPKQEDIAVFVQMNLKNRRHKIIRADELKAVPKPLQIKSEKGKTVSVIVGQKNLSISQPLQESLSDANETKEIPFEALSVDGISENIQTDSEHTRQSTSQATHEPVSEEKIKGVKDTEKSETDNEKSIPAEQRAAAYFKSSGDISDLNKQIDEEKFNIPLPQKSYLQPIKKQKPLYSSDDINFHTGVKDISQSVEPLSHIFLISQVLKMPVLAQAAIRIEQMSMDNTGFISYPLSADIEGAYITEGWYIVKGYFSAYPTKENHTAQGLIRIISTEKCTLPICQEKS